MIEYFIGILMGVAWGATNNIGMVLEKYVINQIPLEERSKAFFKNLIKNKIWVIGFIFDIGVSSIFFILGQLLVGPTLLPGLGASGLIIMAIGSTIIVKEKIKGMEIIAIISLIVAIFLLGFSGLLIEVTNYDFSDESFLIRSAVFLGIIFSLILIFEITQKKSLQFRGLSLAIIAGLWAMIQNFVMAFFTAAISKVTSGSVELIWIFMMIIGGVLAFLSLAISIARMQVGFRYTDAHLAIPVREIPTQVGPAFLYVIVFALTPPTPYSIPFLYISIVLIIISTFVLGKRQAQLEEIDLIEEIDELI